MLECSMACVFFPPARPQTFLGLRGHPSDSLAENAGVVLIVPCKAWLGIASSNVTVSGATITLVPKQSSITRWSSNVARSNRPEIALTRLQLAELLLEHYPDERSEALEHLDFAIGDFHDMKIQPSL